MARFFIYLAKAKINISDMRNEVSTNGIPSKPKIWIQAHGAEMEFPKRPLQSAQHRQAARCFWPHDASR
jgi:hypothetical protein